MGSELTWFELTDIIFNGRLRDKYYTVSTVFQEGVGGTTSVTVCSSASLFDAEPTHTFPSTFKREVTKERHKSTVDIVRRGKWPTY